MTQLTILKVIIVLQIFSFRFSQSNSRTWQCISNPYAEKGHSSTVSMYLDEYKAWFKKVVERIVRGQPGYFLENLGCFENICKCVARKIYNVEYECNAATLKRKRLHLSLIEKNNYHDVTTLECDMWKKSNHDQQAEKINDTKTDKNSNQNKYNKIFYVVHGLRKYFWSWDTTYDMYVAEFVEDKKDEEKYVLKGVLEKLNLSKLCEGTELAKKDVKQPPA